MEASAEVHKKADALVILKTQVRALGIQFLLLKKPYESIIDYDFGFRKQIFQDKDYHSIIDLLQKASEPGCVLYFQNFFYVWYTFCPLPEELVAHYGYEFCLMGPALYEPPSEEMVQRFMQEYHTPSEWERDVREFYHRIPVLPELAFWESLIAPLLTQLWGEKLHFRIADLQTPSTLESDYSNYAYPGHDKEGESTLAAIEDRYKIEAEFMQAVSQGDTRAAVALYYKSRQFHFAPRVEDPLRNLKNFTIILNTLLRKAAQEGAVHPFHIDNLSSQIGVEIEKCRTISEVNNLSDAMVRRYCVLVRKFSRRNYSALVQFCMDYIDSHYAEMLSLDLLCQMRSVTHSYLSGLFRKETDMTVTDYIHTTRIRQSLILLNTTHLSIQEIAVKCGFPDANYYTRIFKKYQGRTPREYRQQIQNAHLRPNSM